jgi:hypothetical protein
MDVRSPSGTAPGFLTVPKPEVPITTHGFLWNYFVSGNPGKASQEYERS